MPLPHGAPDAAIPPRASVVAAVGLVCFTVYVIAAVPTLYWLDSSEFAAASWTLGVPHPPGHPLAVLWGRLFCLLPLGSIGFRVAISQAVAGALAAAALALLAYRIASSVGAPTGAAHWLGIAAVGIFGFTWSHAVQSVRPEVYALHAAALLWAAVAALTGSLRGFVVAALLVGLALANHHALAVVGALPILGLAVSQRPRITPRKVALLACAGLLGLGVYLLLPLRASHHPLVNWGQADRLDRFLWVVTAKTFARAVHRGEGGSVPFEAMSELGVGVLLAALAGLYVLLRARRTRRLGLFLLAEIAIGGLTAGIIAFDAYNPDSHGYLACALAFTAAAAVAPPAFAARLLANRSRTVALAAAALALVLGGAQVARRFPRFSLAQAYGADRILGFALDPIAPRSTLHTRYFQTIFALWYARAVDGVRPDIDIIHEPFFSFRPAWYEPRTSANADTRARYEEYDVHPGGPSPHRLVPAGLFYSVDGAASARAFREQDTAWGRLMERIESSAEQDPETRKFMIWTFYLSTHLRCSLGKREAALRSAERVRTLNGLDPPEIVALLAHCGKD